MYFEYFLVTIVIILIFFRLKKKIKKYKSIYKQNGIDGVYLYFINKNLFYLIKPYFVCNCCDHAHWMLRCWNHGAREHSDWQVPVDRDLWMDRGKRFWVGAIEC